MKVFGAVAGLMLMAAPVMAQGGGGMRMGPPPDHWMTFDSLVAAVGITDAQKADAQKHYDAINTILQQAAQRRAQMRGQMSGPPSEEQRDAMRNDMQKTRTDVEMHYNELRAVLTEGQQAQFDALPKPPYLNMPMRRGPGM